MFSAQLFSLIFFILKVISLKSITEKVIATVQNKPGSKESQIIGTYCIKDVVQAHSS